MIRKRVTTLFLPALLGCCLLPRPAQSTEQCLGGSSDAPIKLEVFSDFQCPACQQFFMDTVRPILKEYSSKGKVCVVYREFPLTVHAYSRQAARYSEAAQKLGQKKWQAVIESLYANQATWAQDGSIEAQVYKALSAEDFQQVKKNLEDESINKTIDDDLDIGLKRGVKLTPTFFLYYIGKEQRVEGGVPYPVLKDFFDRIVK
jgi:protein-disulfide isomerase